MSETTTRIALCQLSASDDSAENVRRTEAAVREAAGKGARIFALVGADILFYPSAIGSEPDRPGYSSAEAWRTVLRSHAIANGVYVAAVNRVGTEDAMTFHGESFVCDPFGEILVRGGAEEAVLVTDVDFARIRELRELLQFFRDRRVETYGPLLKPQHDMMPYPRKRMKK